MPVKHLLDGSRPLKGECDVIVGSEKVLGFRVVHRARQTSVARNDAVPKLHLPLGRAKRRIDCQPKVPTHGRNGQPKLPLWASACEVDLMVVSDGQTYEHKQSINQTANDK